MLRRILALTVFALSFSFATAQVCILCPPGDGIEDPGGGGGGGSTGSVSLSGLTNVELNGTYTYSVSASGGTHTSSLYSVSGGQIISSNNSSVNVKWTSVGSSRWIKVTATISGNIYTSTKYVTVVSSTPVATEESVRTNTSFQANWNPVTDATGYYLDVANNSSYSSYVSGFQNKLITTSGTGDGGLVGPGGVVVTNEVVTGLTPGKNYYYRVRAQKSGGYVSTNSNTITANTSISPPGVVQEDSKTNTSFRAKWGAVSGATYRIDVATSSSFGSTILSNYNNKTVSGTTLTVTGLTPGKNYYYRVKAVGPNHSSGYNSTVTANTTISAPGVVQEDTKTNTSFRAKWGSISGASYRIDVATSSSFGSTILSNYNNKTVSGTTLTVTGLTPGKNYYYRVKAVGPNHSSGYNSTVTANTTINAPGVVQEDSKTNTSFRAKWGAISGATYRIDVATSSSFGSSILSNYNNKTVTGTTLTVSGLTPGKNYYYRVKAVGPNYSSGYNSTVTANTTINAPGVVQEDSRTNTSFRAKWGAISGASYRIDVATSSSFGSTILSNYNNKTVSGTSLTVTGLTPGKNYYYRVKAVGPNHSSGYNSTVTANTSINAPGVVQEDTKTNTSFRAKWGSISGASYRLDVATSSSFGSTILSNYNNVTVSGTNLTVTGLTPGKNYYYRVKAVGPNHSSGYNTTVTANTTIDAPGVLQENSKTNTSFKARWGSINGASYRLDVSTSSSFGSSILSNYNNKTVSGTTLVVTGLTPGKNYYYRVKAVGPNHSSGYNSTVTANTTINPPAVVQEDSKTNTSFRAKWGSISGASYRVDVATSSSFGSSILSNYNNKTVSGTSLTVSGLVPGKNYYYRVRAVGPNYTSSNNSTVTANTTINAPGVVQESNNAATSFNARWGSISGATYQIDVATSSSFGGTILSNYNNKAVTGTSLTVSGLDQGKNYYYRVRAVGPNYTSSSNSTVTAHTTINAPGQVQENSNADYSFNARWGSVSDAASYRLDVSPNVDFGILLPNYTNLNVGNSTSQSVTGLNVGTNYYYRVRAVGSNGQVSSNSTLVTAHTTVPAPSVAQESNNATSSFKAKWNLVLGATSYRLDVSTTSNFSNILSSYNDLNVGSVREYTVSGLDQGNNYYYRVRAVGANGLISPNSSSITAHTTIAAPGVAEESNKTTSSFKANWNTHTYATSYRLDVASDNGFSNILSGYNNLDVGNVTSKTISGLTQGTKYYYRVRAVGNNGSASGNSSTITANTGISKPTLLEETDLEQTSFTANWNAVAGAAEYRVQVSETSDFATFFYNQKITSTSVSITGITYGTTYYYRVKAISADNIHSGYNSFIEVLPRVVPGTISYTDEVCIGTDPGLITGATPTGGDGTYEYQWQYYNGTGWTVLVQGSQYKNYDPTMVLNDDTQFRRKVRSAGGPWRYSSPVLISVVDPITNVGTLSSSTTGDVCPGETVALSFTVGDARFDMGTARLVVVRDGEELDLGALSGTGSTYTADEVTFFEDEFKVKGVQLCTGEAIYSNTLIFSYACNTPPSLDRNFVRTEIPKVPAKTDSEMSVLFANKMTTSYAYVDALGREEQMVSRQAAPDKSDLVQMIQYDDLGRQKIEYLPYAQGNTGAYQTNPMAAQSSFYSGTEKIASDTRPFTEHTYDDSPLNRVIKSIMPGQDWHDNDKNVALDYRFNVSSDNVILWEIQSGLPVGTSSYLANELSVDESTGEDGQITRSFTNNKGQVVLKRIKASKDPDPVVWYDTYYVYDHVENLRFVIPPKLVNEDVTPNLTLLRALGFEYRYDGRKRMVEKYVPGAGGVYMIYDDLDRLIMTQDANQRALSPNQWIYTKYDHFNRPIITGKVNDNRSRVDVQSAVKSFNGNETNGKRFEVRASTSIGYSLNQSYPTNAQAGDVLTVTFYDDYQFKDANWNALDFEVFGAQLGENVNVKGQVTGTMTRVIEGGLLKGVTYYDHRYRPIQTVMENNIGGLDRTSNTYRFDGTLLSTYIDHSSNYDDVTILKEYVYDHADRVLEEYNTIDGGTRVLVAENHYNQLGELVEKNLHSTDDGSTFIQSVDQRYNIRGWLTDINHHELNNDGGVTNDDDDDLFGMRLSYNQDQFSSNGQALEKQYSGNIAGVRWKTNDLDGTTTNSRQAYVYGYDLVNRLTNAVYGAGTNYGGDELYSMNASYDENGNILTLNRFGKLADGSFDDTFDQLSYTYEDGNMSNRLYRVDDTGNDAEGYKEIGGVPGELYYYDDNGNMTADVNKEIVRIKYNHLNLPMEVEFLDGKLITYTYDAAGLKLQQSVDDGSGAPKVTDYSAVGVYEDQDLSFVFTSEGRALKQANSYGYEYFLKDHLGNTRVAFGDLPERTEYKATMETENSAYEESEFTFPANIRVSTENRTPFGNESIALNGTVSGRQVGPAKVLNVHAGDKVEIEAWAKYTFNAWNNTSVNDIASVIASTFDGASVGTGAEGASGALSNALGNPGANGLFTNGQNGEPRAYLQYLFFDDNYVFVEANSGFLAVGSNALGAFAKLEAVVDGFASDGYLFVYAVNESNQDAEVYFDDLNIVHESSQSSLVINSADDYYPFGLTFNSYVKPAGDLNLYKLNGKEFIEHLGLYEYGKRQYDPALSRFISIDPMSDVLSNYSPYQYATNNPIVFKDKDGAYPDPPPWLRRVLRLFGLDPYYQPKDAVEAAEVEMNRRSAIKVGKDVKRAYEAQKSAFTWVPGMSSIYEMVEVRNGQTSSGEAAINVSVNAAVDIAGGKMMAKALGIAAPLIRGIIERTGNAIIRLGKETAEAVLRSTSRLQHGFKHAKDIKSFSNKNWNNNVAQEWKAFNQSIMENADNTFNNTLGDGSEVIGFYKNVDGQNIATYVYASGDKAGQYATTVVLSDNQMKKFNLID